jgi:hypothetical protein
MVGQIDWNGKNLNVVPEVLNEVLKIYLTYVHNNITTVSISQIQIYCWVMHRSSVEEKLQRYQGVKTNMHCLLLNIGLELTMKGLDHKLRIPVK